MTLNEVRLEIGLSPTATLVDCFANANDAGFDPVHVGSKDRLSNFINYTHDSTTDYYYNFMDKDEGVSWPGLSPLLEAAPYFKLEFDMQWVTPPTGIEIYYGDYLYGGGIGTTQTVFSINYDGAGKGFYVGGNYIGGLFPGLESGVLLDPNVWYEVVVIYANNAGGSATAGLIVTEKESGTIITNISSAPFDDSLNWGPSENFSIGNTVHFGSSSFPPSCGTNNLQVFTSPDRSTWTKVFQADMDEGTGSLSIDSGGNGFDGSIRLGTSSDQDFHEIVPAPLPVLAAPTNLTTVYEGVDEDSEHEIECLCDLVTNADEYIFEAYTDGTLFDTHTSPSTGRWVCYVPETSTDIDFYFKVLARNSSGDFLNSPKAISAATVLPAAI